MTIFLWQPKDESLPAEEYVVVESAEIGPTCDEEHALLNGKETVEQWLHEVAREGDHLILVRKVGA